MIKAVRLVSPRYADSAYDGEGARRYGGRWNSKGTSMVYAASSLALAALEMLVHLGDAWVAEETSLVFCVPSVVIPAESNYLINPIHPDAGKLRLTAPQPFQFDPRLI